MYTLVLAGDAVVRVSSPEARPLHVSSMTSHAVRGDVRTTSWSCGWFVCMVPPLLSFVMLMMRLPAKQELGRLILRLTGEGPPTPRRPLLVQTPDRSAGMESRE